MTAGQFRVRMQLSVWLMAAGALWFTASLCSRAAGQDIMPDTIPQRWIDAVMPEDLPDLNYPAYFNDLDKARQQSFHGRYKQSLITLARVKDADPAPVALIRAASLWALGRDREALDTLSPADLADDVPAQVLRARILDGMGQTEQATALLNALVARHPDSIPAHFYLGSICEHVGKLSEAQAAYDWFNDDPQRFWDKWQAGSDPVFDSAENVVLIGRAMDRRAALSGAYATNPALHNAILGMFVRAYDVIDRQYWPAHVAAAEYFLSHDDEDSAVQELKAAWTANPNDQRVLELLGQIAIGNFDFDKADAIVREMRRVNRQSIDADLLAARNLLQQRQPALAEHLVHRVLAVQPRHLEALGLLAAIDYLELHDEQGQSVLHQVEQIDPDNASAYCEVADYLGAMRQYRRAADMYKVAIERAPWWTQPRNGLALLHTQSGDEDAARQELEAARLLDPFNVRTTNYLRLLDQLATFARKQTAHFVVVYDPKADPIVPEYFPEYLDRIYPEVSSDFNYSPPRTSIEVFPSHDAFSVRTAGTPWIGTVGASTGQVIALVAPRKGANTLGPFNWAQVLRHEFTHTVTLGATDNRISHWMTEGLAVQEEQSPVRFEWVPMLYRAVTEHQLFTIDRLTWAFVRPRRPTDRQLAYAESSWICQYIHQTYGREAILRMMDAYKRGVDERDMFGQILGRTQEQFTDDFFAWAEKQVAGWGYDAPTTAKYRDLCQQGEQLIHDRRYVDALPVWEEAAKLRPVDALPQQRLAGLYLSSVVNQPQKAIEHLLALERVEIKDNSYAKRIARLYRDQNRLDEARQHALKAVYTNPYDLSAHELLADICQKCNDQKGLAREKRVIPELKAWIAAQENQAQQSGSQTLEPGQPE